MGKTELLIYALIVAVFLVFNYVMQQAAKRARQQQEQEEAQRQETVPPPEDEPLEDIWGHRRQADLPAAAAPVEPPRRVEPIAASPVRPLSRIAPRALFRSRQDLRHAIVVMTVLGPCRALDPHERH